MSGGLGTEVCGIMGVNLLEFIIYKYCPCLAGAILMLVILYTHTVNWYISSKINFFDKNIHPIKEHIFSYL